MALEFLRLLSTIPDPRRAQGKKWQLGPVLLATILAVLSGACSYRKVHLYIEARLDALNEAFGFGWREAPAYSSIRTILQCLDVQDVEQVFRVHAAGLAESEPDAAADASSHEAEGTDVLPVIAIDGKTLRHSFDGFNDRKAAHTPDTNGTAGTGVDLRVWRDAENHLGFELAKATAAVARLDERLLVHPHRDALITRLAIQEVCDLSWADGADIPIERLALYRVSRSGGGEGDEVIAGLSGKTPARLVETLIAHPVVSTRMLATEGHVSPASAQRALALFEELKLTKEVTGGGRFRYWRAELRQTSRD